MKKLCVIVFLLLILAAGCVTRGRNAIESGAIGNSSAQNKLSKAFR